MTKIKLVSFSGKRAPWLYPCEITNCTEKTIKMVVFQLVCKNINTGDVLHSGTFEKSCYILPGQSERFVIDTSTEWPFIKESYNYNEHIKSQYGYLTQNSYHSYLATLSSNVNVGLMYEDNTTDIVENIEIEYKKPEKTEFEKQQDRGTFVLWFLVGIVICFLIFLMSLDG